ncbi:MAG: NmrA family NAD(P)-binding protein [Nocardioides sp.]
MRVAVVGGNGKTGQAVQGALHRRGVDTVSVGRAQWHDLAGTLDGCDAAYLIAPNLHPDEPGLVAEVLAAVRSAGVPRVVHHSVASPYAPAMPHHLGKARAEDVVRRGPAAWTILQPCAYLQNLVPGLRSGARSIEVAYRVDVPFGLVDLEDVAEASAAVLVEPGHEGATYELGGQSAVTVEDVAVAAGAILGHQVAAVRIPPEEWAAGPGSALDDRQREWLLAMFGYYDQHGLLTGALPLATLLGRPATPLQDSLRAALADGG